MTEMIKIHNASIESNETTLQPEILFTASIPLVQLGSNIPETEGLTESQIMEKLGKVMLEQVFSVINVNKQKYLRDGIL